MTASARIPAINLFGEYDEPPAPHWVERPDGRKILHLWPEAGANSYANDDRLILSPDPALAEIVRFLARRAARQWFARAGGE